MKPYVLLLLAIGCASVLSKPENCASVTQEDCENMTSEYEKYRACMERRTKRSADCYSDDDECSNCDCNTCQYTSSCNSCNKENSCCRQCCQSDSCTSSNCCHQTCRAECRSNSCRTSCKKKCEERIVSEINAPGGHTSEHTSHRSAHNITTVIHLNNHINNTNLIHLPISVNNTVLNNITSRGQYASGYSYGGPSLSYQEPSKDNCCMTIGPRQCVSQKSFPFVRCFHIRKKACGSICLAPVVHYQRHEVCDNDVKRQQSCHQQMVYIPQPQPRCAYQPNWPYVACGNSQLQSCEGCYSHYIKREDLTRCSNFCYDDGYGAGPYYRQGPFYRPGFAHVPSCFQTGTCGLYDGYGYGYGYDYGLPESGFPAAYPYQSYPFVIEDGDKNSDPQVSFDSPNSKEPMHYPSYSNSQPEMIWSNVSDRVLNIDASVSPTRSVRYAEIRIKPDEASSKEEDSNNTVEISTTTVSS